jgi:hypothetical protein
MMGKRIKHKTKLEGQGTPMFYEDELSFIKNTYTKEQIVQLFKDASPTKGRLSMKDAFIKGSDDINNNFAKK